MGTKVDFLQMELIYGSELRSQSPLGVGGKLQVQGSNGELQTGAPNVETPCDFFGHRPNEIASHARSYAAYGKMPELLGSCSFKLSSRQR